MYISFPVVMAEGATPVPIPNTEVKPSSADGTALVTVWESRSLPEAFFVVQNLPNPPISTDSYCFLLSAPNESMSKDTT